MRSVQCSVKTDEPTIVVRGSIAHIKDALLVVEKEVVCKLSRMGKAVLILLASFYVFNKHHSGVFSTVFIFLEYNILGNSIPVSKTSINHFIAQLAHVNDKKPAMVTQKPI